MVVSCSYCQVVGVVLCVLHLHALNESPTLIPFRPELGYTRYVVACSMVKSPRTLESAYITDIPSVNVR